MATLTHARLRELLSYDQSTGVFTRRLGVGKTKAGDVFGTPNGSGYLQGWLDGRNLYKCHHLAWFYVYGEMPRSRVEHVDGVRSNNRINNLRLMGLRKTKRQRLLPKGVSRNGSGYVSRILVGGQVFTLGTFKSAEEASQIYQSTKELFLP